MQVLENFLSDEIETSFWESETKRWKLFKSKLGHRKLLRKWFKATLSSKMNVVRVWKSIFQIFASFWVTKLKPFTRKVSQIVQIYLNQNLVIESFLQKCFEGNLSWKSNVLSVWKEHFWDFLKLLSDQVENIFWKSVKSKFFHRKLLRKQFWSYLELKIERSERLNRAFFNFMQVFEWWSWQHFLGKWDKAFKTIYIKFW